ncbi:uncharacterized protein LOC122292174 [Carya illinoinensis]|uniref:uncharacterized protein LOC122292174 n=1 Tax=Carya illinoinensis TaxID=32201 RepID=UPI001C71E349|nr:uncharacterized protein LOC122292174 [Carya illinoinensis]
MKPKILSWNVRWLNDCNKRLRIRSLLQSWKMDVVCFQETKLRVMDRRIIRSLWGFSYVGWSYLASLGASGEVLLMWDKRVVKSVEECVGNFSIACCFKNTIDGWEWAFADTYGPNLDSERRRLGEELADFIYLWEVSWCIGEDFNIRFPSEPSGTHHHSTAMEEFSEFVFDLDLMDLPLLGGEFTWSNGRGWSRLDRFLVSPSWEVYFRELSQKMLPHVCSDHFPIVLDCGCIIGRRRPFKFENMWLAVEGFVDKVCSWQSSYMFTGNPSFILACKLKALKQDLKKWNLEVFGSIDNQKNTLMEELQDFEARKLTGDLSEEALARKRVVVSELEKVLLMEEISWR